jgi:hypothetical protein
MRLAILDRAFSPSAGKKVRARADADNARRRSCRYRVSFDSRESEKMSIAVFPERERGTRPDHSLPYRRFKTECLLSEIRRMRGWTRLDFPTGNRFRALVDLARYRSLRARCHVRFLCPSIANFARLESRRVFSRAAIARSRRKARA